MNRRGFLGGLIGVVAAPAVVRAESLMKIWVPPGAGDITLDSMPWDQFEWDVQTEMFGQLMAEVREMIAKQIMDGCQRTIYGERPNSIQEARDRVTLHSYGKAIRFQS